MFHDNNQSFRTDFAYFSLAYWMLWPYRAMYSATSPFGVVYEDPPSALAARILLVPSSIHECRCESLTVSILALLAIATRISTLSLYEESVCHNARGNSSSEFPRRARFHKKFVRQI
jgi:hypothetical protein